MIFDSKNYELILFGGYSADHGYLGDTWAFDYSIGLWYQLTLSNRPSPRDGFEMTADWINKRAFLFGGFNNVQGTLNDTWNYDFSTRSWVNLYPTTRPPARENFGMAFDLANQKLILFGGYNGSVGCLGDTWALYCPELPTQSLTLITPNGKEAWGVGTTRNITWTSNKITGNVKIELNRNYPSGSWEVLFSSTPNDGIQPWTVSGPLSSSARIRITSLSNPLVSDISDSNFRITLPPALSLTSPNGGESWEIGSTRNILWDYSGILGNVKIELNRNYPSGSWEVLFASTSNDGNEPWRVTGPESTACRMRISSVSDPTISDVSNANFAIISPPALSITPTFLDFGSTLESLNLTVRNSGGGTLSWLASESLPWLSLSPTTGNLGGRTIAGGFCLRFSLRFTSRFLLRGDLVQLQRRALDCPGFNECSPSAFGDNHLRTFRLTLHHPFGRDN
jgi:hypothetical protein